MYSVGRPRRTFIESSVKKDSARLSRELLTIGFILPLGFEMHLPLTKTGIFAILANGVFYISSWVLFFKGASIIGATRSSMLACIEPLFAALLAIILLKQILSFSEWIGFFIVLTAIYTFEKNSAKPEACFKE